jgi:hypothetical protein
MTLTTFDFKDNKWQFFCGDCNRIVRPNMLKTHLSRAHKINIKESHPDYVNAMINIYYFVITEVPTFKKAMEAFK